MLLCADIDENIALIEKSINSLQDAYKRHLLPGGFDDNDTIESVIADQTVDIVMHIRKSKDKVVILQSEKVVNPREKKIKDNIIQFVLLAKLNELTSCFRKNIRTYQEKLQIRQKRMHSYFDHVMLDVQELDSIGNTIQLPDANQLKLFTPPVTALDPPSVQVLAPKAAPTLLETVFSYFSFGTSTK